MREYRVLLLGDEIRLAYQPRTAELLAAEEGIGIEVVGPKESTGTSADLAERIDGWLEQYTPDAVHFNAGLADVCYHRAEKHHAIPLGEYELYLRRVVEACKPRLGGDIIFATTTPVIDDLQCDVPDTVCDRCNRDIEEYNIAAQEIMLGDNVLINHLDRIIGERDDAYIGPDGFSLTPAGVEAAAQATAACIRSLWH